MIRLGLFLLLSTDGILAFTPLVRNSFLSRRDVVTTFATTTSEISVLEEIGVPTGLRETILSSNISKRLWIVDNSGSMQYLDGHRVLQPGTDASRWSEVQETVHCHAELASTMGAPTEFRLLNPPPKGSSQKLRVGYGKHGEAKRIQSMLSKNRPQGMTPLPQCIHEVRKEIIQMKPQLDKDGSKVAIIIASDGSSHNLQNIGKPQTEVNQELVQALESLQGLPVWVVIRLCTDYQPILDFYNGLDETLDLDVLDDHAAEAQQVYEHNPWLNYALVLHRVREMGEYHELLDALDERPLTRHEIVAFCQVLLGGNLSEVCGDWETFLQEVDRRQRREKRHRNPLTKEVSCWIDLEELLLMD